MLSLTKRNAEGVAGLCWQTRAMEGQRWLRLCRDFPFSFPFHRLASVLSSVASAVRLRSHL